MRFFFVSVAVLAFPAFKLYKAIEQFVKHPVNDMVEHADQVVVHADQAVVHADQAIQDITKLVEEVKTLVIKLQTSSDKWNELVDVVEFVPIKKKIRKIVHLPFMCCKAKEEPMEVAPRVDAATSIKN